MSYKFKVNKPSEFEKDVLKFWQENKIFEKSIEKPAGKKPKSDYVFFDGPPFATGTPHYGHIVASAMKDAVPRYWTMKGYRVKRKWGWDCHGLPIENIAEKELGIKHKKEIEEIGVGKFNEFCRSKIFDYVDEWKKVIGRLGRWADIENPYSTMDASFMESVWWVFKQLWDKGLIYENYRSMHICPRCETTLSQQEVSDNYKDIKDISVTAKFELIDEPNTYVLAWTTTPWTLPGNVALAVNPDMEYLICKSSALSHESKISVGEEILKEVKVKTGIYILGKDVKGIRRILQEIVDPSQFDEYVMGKRKINDVEGIIKIVKGKDLIGKKYKPLFNYYLNDKNLKNCENGWKIYAGDFVTTEEGTGVVHIAPAFGEDDFKLMEKENLPFIQHIGMDGVIKPEAKDFAGMCVKPIDDHQKTDIEIIKNLASRGLLFAKEKYEHSYPHCWRCDTPLINYATSSWFVNILKIKDKAIELAKGINWSPAHIKEGRFGKWLEGARDWSISRQRYWASAMPIWKCEKCKEIKVIGSIEDIKKSVRKSGNKYFVMRHGEAEQNVLGILNSKSEINHYHLTQKGEKQALVVAKTFRRAQGKIDLIFSSDLLRAKETAEIIADNLKISRNKIIFDKKINEVSFGIFDGKTSKEYRNYFSSYKERFFKNPPNGENFSQLKNRVSEFLYDIDKKYSNKNILIVSHEAPIWCMFAGAIGADVNKALEITENKKEQFVKTGGILKLDFVPLPHNDNYELDLHRPYIDEIEFDCKCGGKMGRVSDVLDTWFDSGSMPYAQAHYPFENKKKFEENFPAEFIAEGLDQTRAWFYYLHCIATAIKNSRAFNNVIVNGIALAEDGKKMSKRLKNYPDPMDVINKYGADALRLYLLSSPVVRAENLNFSEKGVDEVYKKTIMRLWNTYQFYEMYAEKSKIQRTRAKISTGCGKNQNLKLQIKNLNILDRWILARLSQLILEVSMAMDKYELDKAVRPLGDFVEDLSTWYLRRSRRRFQKSDDKKDFLAASYILNFILAEFSKLIAPFAPFISEVIYKNISNCESVHLESWPEINKKIIDKKLFDLMSETRKLASLALAKRAEAGIKVRQPLKSLKIKSEKLKEEKELLEVLAAEINVKKVIFDDKILDEIELDINVTAELKEEGMIREVIRIIQDLRQEAGYHPKDKVSIYIQASGEMKIILNNHLRALIKELNAENFEFMKKDKVSAQIQTKFEGGDLWIGIKKI